MEKYTLQITKAAKKYFDHCDATMRHRLQEKFDTLKADPFELQHSKPLKGRNEQRSARVGNLRILFRIEGTVIIIAHIAPRGQIYKHHD